MKKKIGISFTEIKFKNYWNWFTKEDVQDDAELVELSFEKNNTEDIYTCDGFILTGGVDVHPSLYGGMLEYDNKPSCFSPLRDNFEEKIYRFAQSNNKPVLGICRGMQLVNVLHGGKLIQDLKAGGNERHRREADIDKQHNVIVERDTLLYDVTLCKTGNVNSAHHQAIDPNAIGENLQVNSLADTHEKTIEGIEFKDKTNKGYMLCVQWHPERMDDQESVFCKNIKTSFLEAVALALKGVDR
jgi:putative glutamine amidotransferase